MRNIVWWFFVSRDNGSEGSKYLVFSRSFLSLFLVFLATQMSLLMTKIRRWRPLYSVVMPLFPFLHHQKVKEERNLFVLVSVVDNSFSGIQTEHEHIFLLRPVTWFAQISSSDQYILNMRIGINASKFSRDPLWEFISIHGLKVTSIHFDQSFLMTC